MGEGIISAYLLEFMQVDDWKINHRGRGVGADNVDVDDKYAMSMF